MSDAMFATMAKVEGKDFELNEGNQILDWRKLRAEPRWRQHSKLLAVITGFKSIALWTAYGLLYLPIITRRSVCGMVERDHITTSMSIVLPPNP